MSNGNDTITNTLARISQPKSYTSVPGIGVSVLSVLIYMYRACTCEVIYACIHNDLYQYHYIKDKRWGQRGQFVSFPIRPQRHRYAGLMKKHASQYVTVTGKKSVESFRNHCVIEQKITQNHTLLLIFV